MKPSTQNEVSRISFPQTDNRQRQTAAQNLQAQQAALAFSATKHQGKFPFFHSNTQLLETLLKLVQQLLQQLNCDKPDTSCKPKKGEYRSVDGSGNNPQHPEFGQAEKPFLRQIPADASRELGGSTEVDLANPREISNAVSRQEGNTENKKGLSDMFWLWGQFLDHDINLTPSNEKDVANIKVPKGDPLFDPSGTGAAEIGFSRSTFDKDGAGQRQQVNDITAFIDGSNVYGSDEETAEKLRSFEGGRLRISEGNYLPEENDAYLAGDERANEHAGLTAMHTLWMREHNRIADKLADKHPRWSDERIYQEARKEVVAEIQAITYNEFLPQLLGTEALPEYTGYKPDVDPQISNSFATAAFRLGHSMLSPELLRLDEQGKEIPEGNLSLREAFFRPENISEGGIDSIFRGFASQTAQAIDPMVIDDVRNFLFGQPGQGGFDLAALNIQRGRDHGLSSFNDSREALGLSKITSFDDPIWGEHGAKLAQVYDHPDEVDLWVGGLAENEKGDSLVGETFSLILEDQFTRLRDGDRFWYENQYSGRKLRRLNNVSLSDIIKRNTEVSNIQDDVMVASNVHQSTAQEADTEGRKERAGKKPLSQAALGDIGPATFGRAAAQAALQTVQDTQTLMNGMLEQTERLQEALRKGLFG